MMRPHTIAVGLVLTVLLLAPGSLLAKPADGHDCAGCHGSAAADGYNDNRLALTGTDGTANPTERPGAIDRGTLPVYQVLPGSAKALTLTASSLPAGTKHSALTNNFQRLGVVGGNALSFTPDAAWTTRSGGGLTWYSKSGFATTATFNIGIPSSAVPDFYEFELGWGGISGEDAGFKRFYIQVLSAIANAQWNLNGNGSWSVAGNWIGGVPNSVDATASFGSIITTARTITVDSAQTAGSLVFSSANPYTLAGTGTLTLDVSSGSVSINVTAGNHAISAPLTLNDDAAITAAAGSGITLGGALTAAGRTISKAGAGSAQFESVRAGALNVTGGIARISPKPSPNSPLGTSQVTSLNISAGAQLDLANNSMVIDYTTLGSLGTEVRQHLASLRMITSSGDANRRLGYGDNAVLGRASFAGLTVDATSLLIKYTYLGDSNLDGQVDITDLAALATAWQTSGEWINGDFDYSGFIDITDLAALATNWQAGVGAPLSMTFEQALASVGLGGVSVPEPLVGGLGIVAAGVLTPRRRRTLGR